MNLLTQETRPHPEDTRLIPLTQGQFAIVWASDYDWLMQWKWFANKFPSIGGYYAVRSGSFSAGDRGKTYLMTRVICGLQFGDKRRVDHINRNTLDNRRSNLRVVDNWRNAGNAKMNKKNKSGYKGVSWNSEYSMWVAQLQHKYQRMHLGYFNSLELAAKAYQDKALELREGISGELSRNG